LAGDSKISIKWKREKETGPLAWDDPGDEVIGLMRERGNPAPSEKGPEEERSFCLVNGNKDRGKLGREARGEADRKRITYWKERNERFQTTTSLC